MPLIDCPRCYRGTLLREGDTLTCLNCGWFPQPMPIEFEEYPAHETSRRQKRTGGPRLKVAEEKQ